jgi:hypothetical protein
MKIIKILSAVMFSVLLFSCGGKGTDKEEKSPDKKMKNVVVDCNCSELTEADADLKGVAKKGSKELYSGVCVTRDQHDTITNKNTYKNGWLVNEIVKEKIGNEYIITKDIDYENGNIESCKLLETKGNNSQNFNFVTQYKEKQNKKWIIGYEINIERQYSESASDYIDKYNLIVMTYYMDGKKFSYENTSQQPTSMPNSDVTGGGGWRLDGLSENRLSEILDGLKKEFPHFNYWKN